MSRHDGVGSQEADVGVAQVHGPPFPLAATGFPAEDLGHRGLGIPAPGEEGAVAAVGGQYQILLGQGGNTAHGDRLLSDAGVGGTADQSPAGEFHHLLLELPDVDHLAVPAQSLVRADCRSAFGLLCHVSYPSSMRSLIAAANLLRSGKTSSCNGPLGIGWCLPATRRMGATR